MAVSNHVRGIPGLTAAADLSAVGQVFVKLTGAYQVNVCGNGEAAIGVLMNAPTAGQAAKVAGLGDLAAVKAGAAVAAGANVMSDATGRAITAAIVGSYILGQAMDAAAAANVIAEVYLDSKGRF